MSHDFRLFALLASNDSAILGSWAMLVIVVALFIVALIPEYVRRSRALTKKIFL
jgi:hypothetical protein